MTRADREAIDAALGQYGDEEGLRDSHLFEDEDGVIEEEVYEEETYDDSDDL